MSGAVLGALATLVIGMAGLKFWVDCRKSKEKWERYARAFALSTSERFANGFTGSGILLYIGLVGYGVGLLGFAALDHTPGQSVTKDVGLVLFVVGVASILSGLIASIFVALAQRPVWFFPHRE
ncbi:hypothetical protein [Nostocoides sp. Soil756]|uniref:hypothetical protein n=1 Tax=Nostocoides sp. Soil756 TaxID=1736399 RepID=UPI0012FB5896|nr:hypothetical protein [Tetrasphaera sp. Soil756]